ncbi:MAG: hypothetical protein JW751_30065 [Polyangiaceae bacterium]|nr:hypothetical protein [Polyangiaceae bacterium]
MEAKSGATIARDFFDALRKLGEAATAAHPTVPVLRWVVYGGDAEQRRTDAMALPWRDVARILAGGCVADRRQHPGRRDIERHGIPGFERWSSG